MSDKQQVDRLCKNCAHSRFESDGDTDESRLVTGEPDGFYACALYHDPDGRRLTCIRGRLARECGSIGTRWTPKYDNLPKIQNRPAVPLNPMQEAEEYMRRVCEAIYGPKQNWTREQRGQYLSGLGLLFCFVDRK